MKFGISFTASFLNQAGALIHIYTDGTHPPQPRRHGNGPGAEHRSRAGGGRSVPGGNRPRARSPPTNTDKVPNTSPTAASSGADLNGKAAQNAAEIIKQRLINSLRGTTRSLEEDVKFHNGHVRVRDHILTFEALIPAGVFQSGVTVEHRLLQDPENLLRPQPGPLAVRSTTSPSARRAAK